MNENLSVALFLLVFGVLILLVRAVNRGYRPGTLILVPIRRRNPDNNVMGYAIFIGLVAVGLKIFGVW